MISDKSSLASRLGWIIGETEALIGKGQESFSLYMKDREESALENTIEAWQDILGCLDVLNAEGAYMLAREVTLLLIALQRGEVKHKEDAYHACAEGMVQLSEYLRHLQEGYADLPVIILPTLNELRAARDVELLSEHLVFLPEEGAVTNEQIGTSVYFELDREQHEQVCKRLRAYMQKGLVGWYKGDAIDEGLGKVGQVSKKVMTLNHTHRLRSLWWVTSGLVSALEHQKLEHNVAVKMLLGRMEREIRRFGELGEELYGETVPDELIKNLLYYIGLADSGVPLLDKIKETYQLDLYLPRGESLEQLRQYYMMPGRELWRSVANSMNEEIAQVVKFVEGLNEAEDQTAAIQSVTQKSQSIAQALNMLGLSQASQLTHEFTEQLDKKITVEKTLDRDSLTQIDTFFLKLEKVLKEYAETGYDTTELVFAEGEGHFDPETTRGAIRTALSELVRANAELTAFSKEEGTFFRLHDVIKNLRDISGTLSMMEAHEVVPLSTGVAYYLQNDLRDKRRTPREQEIAILADILTLLEAVLSASIQHEDHLSLIPVGYEKIEELDTYTDLDLAVYIKLNQAKAILKEKQKQKYALPQSLYHKVRKAQPLAMSC